MARAGIVFGLLLCGVTYAGLVGISAKIPTQFVPMMFGIPMLFCGVVALNPHRRRMSMQVALSIGMLGCVGGILWLSYQMIALASGQDVNRDALVVIGVMSLLCTTFDMLCLRWFSKMRRKNGGMETAKNKNVKLLRTVSDESSSNHNVTARESA